MSNLGAIAIDNEADAFGLRAALVKVMTRYLIALRDAAEEFHGWAVS